MTKSTVYTRDRSAVLTTNFLFVCQNAMFAEHDIILPIFPDHRMYVKAEFSLANAFVLNSLIFISFCSQTQTCFKLLEMLFV